MKTKILPPRLFQFAILTMVLIHFLLPLFYLYHSPVRYIGIIPLAAGIFLNLRSDRLISQHHTTIKPFESPSTLIESGPFRFSRNPIYLGMVLILLGAAFISGSLLNFAMPLIFGFLMHFLYIRAEEERLEKEFRELYLSYKKRVPCWI